MLVGTDGSIRTCKDEGYLMMDYDGRRRFSHAQDVKFIRYLPADCRQEGQKQDYGLQWTRLDAADLWEIYQHHKSGVDSCCDCNFQSIDEIDGYFPMLHLADNIDAYCGIFD